MQSSRPPQMPAQMALDPPLYVLPPRWSLAAQAALHDVLQSNATRPVRLSAANLKRVDCLMLQYLLSAARAWAARGLDFALVDIPAPVGEVFDLLGVTPAMLERRT